jgi:hypothetical protein
MGGGGRTREQGAIMTKAVLGNHLVFRLVGTDEDLSRYEGTEHGEQSVGKLFTARPAPAGE